MKETLTQILIAKEGYSQRSAEITANDLCCITDDEIHTALVKWVTTGEHPNIFEGDFDCKSLLTSFGMKYPAALIFIDWYRSNPIEAMKCLRNQGG